MSTVRNLVNQQNRLYEVLRASVQHIVQNGRQGEWADARNSSTAIWALSSCGIQEKAPLYIQRSLERLFQYISLHFESHAGDIEGALKSKDAPG